MSLLPQFLSQVRSIVQAADGDRLRAWLQVEPSAPRSYHDLATELRAQFQPGAATAAAALEAAVERALPEDDDVPEGQATAWPGLVSFVRDYLLFWRDVDYEDLLGTHDVLSGLVNSCSTAFAHPTYGTVLLQTSMSLSESLSRFTMLLSRRPDLVGRRRRAGRGEDESRKTVAETSAEIIQKIFTACLTDRSGGGRPNGRPEGKKGGVYMFANLVLRLLSAGEKCGRTHLATQIFTNITTNSPPLSLYPAAQRVTFLYYLGRFHFANGHYLWAARCLEEAYLQTPAVFASHRAAILTHLVPANLLLGRLPSLALLRRPEAVALAPVFSPIARAIRTGDFVLFQHSLAAHQTWLLDRALLLPLAYRLRPLLWRALSRRTFLLTYVPDADSSSRRAATLDLGDLLVAATYVQRLLEGWVPRRSVPLLLAAAGRRPSAPAGVSSVFLQAIRNSSGGGGGGGAPPDLSDQPTTLVPPPGGPRALRPNEGLVCGNLPVTADGVEMTVAELIQQGLLHGFIAHSQQRFAIIGAKQKGSPALAGWPDPYTVIMERRYDEDVDWENVPGWVKG